MAIPVMRSPAHPDGDWNDFIYTNRRLLAPFPVINSALLTVDLPLQLDHRKVLSYNLHNSYIQHTRDVFRGEIYGPSSSE